MYDSFAEQRGAKNQPLIRFYNDAFEDKNKSEKEGRPVFRDVEMVELRFPADRNRSGIFRAAATCIDPRTQKRITYMERFNEQYKRFKSDQPQMVTGTPIKEAPFLTEAQRRSMKALDVYTIEQLAGLSGTQLKNLGVGGGELQQKAIAYIENARGTADVVAMAAEIERLNKLLNASNVHVEASNDPQDSGLAGLDDDALKAIIKEATGEAPRGNPKRETLLRMIADIRQQAA